MHELHQSVHHSTSLLSLAVGLSNRRAFLDRIAVITRKGEGGGGAGAMMDRVAGECDDEGDAGVR